MSEINIEVKGIKTFKGMEGIGYNANLYIDGKKTAEIIDDASGGPIQIHQINKELFKKLEAYAESLPPYEGTITIPMDAEMYIEELVNKALFEKEVKKLCRTKTVFAEKEGGDMYTLKIRYSPAIRKQLIAKYGESVVIYNEIHGIPKLEAKDD